MKSCACKAVSRPAPLIARFYAARLGLLDKARILAGKPPVPVGAAWRAGWASACDLDRGKQHNQLESTS